MTTTTTTQSLFGLITLKVTLPDFKKGAHITVRDNDGIERSGIVIMADGQHNYMGQYLTLKLDVPFEHPRAMIGTITHTISLHVHSDNWIGWVKYPNQHSNQPTRLPTQYVNRKTFVMIFQDYSINKNAPDAMIVIQSQSVDECLETARWNQKRVFGNCSWHVLDVDRMYHVASFGKSIN